MKEFWIDLSHPIHPGMPVYPGTEEPLIERAFTIESHGFREARIHMVSHTGTHMDAPSHMIIQGNNLDQYPVGTFGGTAHLLPVNGPEITLDQLGPIRHKELNDAWVLIKTGWSKHWDSKNYFDGFPVLRKEAAEYLANSGLKGIGIDCISFDPVGDIQFENHQILMEGGLILVENLTQLEKIPAETFYFVALPLALREADGAPVRAVAIIKSSG